MLFSLKEIEGFKLRTPDGDFGEVKAFLIDDFDWVVRYLIIDMDDRHIILSPHAVSGLMVEDKTIITSLDLDTIMNSPRVDLDQDLSRELERQLSDYFHWPYYWEPTEYPNTMPGDLTAVPLIDMELERSQIEAEELVPETGSSGESAAETNRQPRHFHLRSTHEIIGYTLRTTNDDSNAGKLEDLIVQDDDWNIMYMLADTGGLLSSKKVLVSLSWVQSIDEDQRQIRVELNEETVKESPEVQSVKDITPEFQARLKNYYG